MLIWFQQFLSMDADLDTTWQASNWCCMKNKGNQTVVRHKSLWQQNFQHLKGEKGQKAQFAKISLICSNKFFVQNNPQVKNPGWKNYRGHPACLKPTHEKMLVAPNTRSLSCLFPERKLFPICKLPSTTYSEANNAACVVYEYLLSHHHCHDFFSDVDNGT